MKWPDAAPMIDGVEAVRSAVSDVAERSFFAMVEACADDHFAEVSTTYPTWLVASVHFADHDCAGTVVCRLPLSLAGRLFDAFTGRDQADPAATAEEIADLVGEFANMICGSWLTRAANSRTFTLGHPQVGASVAPALTDAGLPLTIDGQPCLIEIAFTHTPEPAVTY